MNGKTLLPNLIAAAVALAGWLLGGSVGGVLLSTGLFALSGALTNWLAIHMLFERVPGLYGSGVIALRFEDLKRGIIDLVRDELFGKDKVERLFDTALKKQATPTPSTPAADTGTHGSADTATETAVAGEYAADDNATQNAASDADNSAGHHAGEAGAHKADAGIDMSALVDSIDINAAFDQLLETVEASSFGNLLQMVGGISALEPLREPFGKRLKRILNEAASSPKIRSAVARQLNSEANRERFRQRLELLLQARLDELTPEMVRDLMSRLIRRHLGWLVVWGGVFGGLIGLAAGLLGTLS